MVVQGAPLIRVIEGEANIASLDHARSSPPICPQRTTVYQVRTGNQPGSVTHLRVESHWSYLSLDERRVSDPDRQERATDSPILENL
jgi:transposase